MSVMSVIAGDGVVGGPVVVRSARKTVSSSELYCQPPKVRLPDPTAAIARLRPASRSTLGWKAARTSTRPRWYWRPTAAKPRVSGSQTLASAMTVTRAPAARSRPSARASKKERSAL